MHTSLSMHESGFSITFGRNGTFSAKKACTLLSDVEDTRTFVGEIVRLSEILMLAISLPVLSICIFLIWPTSYLFRIARAFVPLSLPIASFFLIIDSIFHYFTYLLCFKYFFKSTANDLHFAAGHGNSFG
jgi:hypothetical protein